MTFKKKYFKDFIPKERSLLTCFGKIIADSVEVTRGPHVGQAKVTQRYGGVSTRATHKESNVVPKISTVKTF